MVGLKHGISIVGLSQLKLCAKAGETRWAFRTLLVLTSILFSAGVSAQTIDQEALLGLYGDEATISIASGIRQPVSRAPAVASVITSDTIEAMGAADLDEVLEAVPGLHVSRSHIGYNPIYTFRGIHSRYNPQVLVLINGVPITNLHLGDRGNSWGGMPVAAIARIEVIRGPGSALYGADAFAGVINIITKTGQDIRTHRVAIGAGSNATRDVAYLTSWQWSNLDFGLVVEHHQTDGDDSHIASDAQTNLDAVYGTNASLAPGPVNLSRNNTDIRFDVKLEETLHLRAGYQGRRDWGIGAGVAEALDPYGRYASDKYNLDVTWHNQLLDDKLQFDTTMSYLDTSHEVERPLIIFPRGVDFGEGAYPDGYIGNPEVFERHYRFGLSAQYLGIDRHRVSWGAGYYKGDVHKVKESKNFGIDPNTGMVLMPGAGLVDVTDTEYVFLREDNRENRFIYVQDIWRLANDWELTAGVRHDHYSDFGDTTNPRLALVWQTSYDLTTKILYGQAFRAPSFAETRAINNPVVLGNPSLEPESLRSYELAFDYRVTEQLDLLLNLYHYRWLDIIEFVPDPNENSNTARNLGRQEGDGFEVEINWKPLPSLLAAVNYAYVALDETGGNDEGAMAPTRQLFAKLQWQPNQSWLTYWQLNHVGGRGRAHNDSRENPDDYLLVDLNLMYLGQRYPWTVNFKIDNLFDADAREPTWWTDPVANISNDLPLAGRHYSIKFSLDFE